MNARDWLMLGVGFVVGLGVVGAYIIGSELRREWERDWRTSAKVWGEKRRR